MSVEHSLDADAFMRKYLARPADATARLVFADWLEETGEEHNAAWAHFIRLKAEADRYPPDSPTRHEIDRHAGQYALQIRARLTIPAKLFVGYPKSLLQLLPAQNITVDLSRFTVPRAIVELMPESVARENLLFPLDAQGRAILVATAHPTDIDLLQKLEFILNRDVVLVGAEADDVRDATDREYGQTEVESVDSYTPLLAEFDDAPPEFVSTDLPEPDPSAEPVVRLVNLFVTEAIGRRVDGIRLVPEPDCVVVSYLANGAWTERDRLPRRLLHPVAVRLAILAWLRPESVLAHTPVARHHGMFRIQAYGLRIHVAVVMTTSPNGPLIALTLRYEPPVPVEDR